LRISCDQFFGGLVLSGSPRLEHVDSVRFKIHTCNLLQFRCCIDILFSRCRRLEQQRIRDDCRNHQSRHLFCDFKSVFLIDIVEDCRCTSHRFRTIVERGFCVEVCDAVVVEHFQDLRFFDVVRGLLELIMVDQDDGLIRVECPEDLRCRSTEVCKHVFCLRIDFTEAESFCVAPQTAFDVCCNNRGCDRIRVRILMSKNFNCTHV